MGRDSKIIDLTAAKRSAKPSKRSIELKMALKDFISMHGDTYYEGPDTDALKQYFRLSNGMCVEQKILFGADDCTCYSTLHIRARPDETGLIHSLVMEANAINRELNYGNFEVDTSTGEIMFRSHYSPGNMIYMEDIDVLLGYPRHIISIHGARFREILEERGAHIAQ